MIPSLGGLAWEGVIPSLGGLTWELFMFTWELFRLHEAELFVWEAKLLLLVLLDLVIFPSFLIVSKFSLFNCLSLTLLNLVSPTLSTKSWHSLSFYVETIVTNLARNLKESIYFRVNNPSLNNNVGKFNLSHIWDRVLLNTNGLSLK